MGNKPFSLSVKALVRDANGCCLLLRRSAASQGNAGKWDLPGGKLDPGESVDRALCREVAEETGLAVSVERVVGAAQSELPDRIIAYLVMEARAGSGPVRLSAEHDDFTWADVRELARMDLAPPFLAFARTYGRAREE